MSVDPGTVGRAQGRGLREGMLLLLFGSRYGTQVSKCGKSGPDRRELAGAATFSISGRASVATDGEAHGSLA